MYFSFIPGRVRFRSENRNGIQQIAQATRDMPEVFETVHNERTGSLLVRFDSSAYDESTFRLLAESHLAPKSKSANRTRLIGKPEMRVIKRGMLTSLAISMIFALLDKEKWHIFLGLFFLMFLSGHLYGYRNSLLA